MPSHPSIVEIQDFSMKVINNAPEPPSISSDDPESSNITQVNNERIQNERWYKSSFTFIRSIWFPYVPGKIRYRSSKNEETRNEVSCTVCWKHGIKTLSLSLSLSSGDPCRDSSQKRGLLNHTKEDQRQ